MARLHGRVGRASQPKKWWFPVRAEYETTVKTAVRAARRQTAHRVADALAAADAAVSLASGLCALRQASNFGAE
jgi:hypothetical protein